MLIFWQFLIKRKYQEIFNPLLNLVNKILCLCSELGKHYYCTYLFGYSI